MGVGLMANSFALDGILLVVEDEADERYTFKALQVIQKKKNQKSILTATHQSLKFLQYAQREN